MTDKVKEASGYDKQTADHLWRVYYADKGQYYQAYETQVKSKYVEAKIGGENVELQRSSVTWETVPLKLEREN